jgi:hypothetical protein
LAELSGGGASTTGIVITTGAGVGLGTGGATGGSPAIVSLCSVQDKIAGTIVTKAAKAAPPTDGWCQVTKEMAAKVNNPKIPDGLCSNALDPNRILGCFLKIDTSKQITIAVINPNKIKCQPSSIPKTELIDFSLQICETSNILRI